MDKRLENTFVKIFSEIASMCTNALSVKYKIGAINSDNLTDHWKEFYTKALPEEIKKRENDLNINFDNLFAEIESNLLELKDVPTLRLNYCRNLLSPFADFLRTIKPTTYREKELKEMTNKMELLSKSNSENDRKRAKEIEEEVINWKNTEQKFWDITQGPAPSEDDKSFEKYFEECHTEVIFSELMHNLKEYAEMLDWTFAQNGIDLLKLQDESGIYLIEGRNIYNYIQYSGTKENAQRIFDALPKCDTQTCNSNETDTEIKTPALDFLFRNAEKGAREKFVKFFSLPVRDNVELGATNVVLVLKMILRNDLKQSLTANKIQLKELWSELRQLNLVRKKISDNTLNKARRNPASPKPEILSLWNSFHLKTSDSGTD